MSSCCHETSDRGEPPKGFELTKDDGGSPSAAPGCERFALHALVGEVDRVLRRANVALAVHLTRAGFEERRPPTEQHRREVDAQLVDETLFERLADDVAAAHDDNVTVGRGGPRLVDRGDQIGRASCRERVLTGV